MKSIVKLGIGLSVVLVPILGIKLWLNSTNQELVPNYVVNADDESTGGTIILRKKQMPAVTRLIAYDKKLQKKKQLTKTEVERIGRLIGKSSKQEFMQSFNMLSMFSRVDGTSQQNEQIHPILNRYKNKYVVDSKGKIFKVKLASPSSPYEYKFDPVYDTNDQLSNKTKLGKKLLEN